jgi:hypothetical protein
MVALIIVIPTIHVENIILIKIFFITSSEIKTYIVNKSFTWDISSLNL